MNFTSTSSKNKIHSRDQAFLWAVGFLIVAYAAGVVGLSWPVTQPYFKWATPIHLVVSAVLLLWFHPQWNGAFWVFLVSTFLLGYGIEVIGVHTEAVFGTYRYGDTLGPKALDVPLVIGVNWLMLTYGIGILCNKLPGYRLVKSLVAALLMVALDYFIEPVAIALDFWQWKDGVIPPQNYLGWFAVAWAMQLLFLFLPFAKKNPLAPYLIAVQWIFFLLLGTILV